MSDMKITKAGVSYLVHKSDDTPTGLSGCVYVTDGVSSFDLPVRGNVGISTGTQVDSLLIDPHHACRSVTLNFGGRLISLLVEDDESTVTVWEGDKQLLSLND